MTPPTEAEIDGIAGYAERAYRLGLGGHWHTATATITALNNEHHERGLGNAVLMWADAALHHLGFAGYTADGHEPHPVQLLWQEEDGTVRRDNPGLDPAERWTGRILAARLADDSDQFYALMNSLIDLPGEQVGANVLCLLTAAVRAHHNNEGRAEEETAP